MLAGGGFCTAYQRIVILYCTESEVLGSCCYSDLQRSERNDLYGFARESEMTHNAVTQEKTSSLPCPPSPHRGAS